MKHFHACGGHIMSRLEEIYHTVARIRVEERKIRFISNCKWGFARWKYHYDNTTHKYTMHISHKSQNEEKQISSQSYTNSEEHIIANEYSAEKGEEIKLSLIQALETD
jgi:hypothetical protein